MQVLTFQNMTARPSLDHPGQLTISYQCPSVHSESRTASSLLRASSISTTSSLVYRYSDLFKKSAISSLSCQIDVITQGLSLSGTNSKTSSNSPARFAVSFASSPRNAPPSLDSPRNHATGRIDQAASFSSVAVVGSPIPLAYLCTADELIPTPSATILIPCSLIATLSSWLILPGVVPAPLPRVILSPVP